MGLWCAICHVSNWLFITTATDGGSCCHERKRMREMEKPKLKTVDLVNTKSANQYTGGSQLVTVPEERKRPKRWLIFQQSPNITQDVRVIPMNDVNTTIQRLANNDVKHRFVIDVASALNSPTTN